MRHPWVILGETPGPRHKISPVYCWFIKQVQIHYRSGTGGRWCVCTGRRFVFAHQAAALFPWNDVMAVISKLWLQIENLTPSIDAYLHWKHSCQISSRSDLKLWSLKFLKTVAPTRTRRTTIQTSVPDLIFITHDNRLLSYWQDFNFRRYCQKTSNFTARHVYSYSKSVFPSVCLSVMRW